MFAMVPTLPQRARGFHAFLWCGCLHHWLASVDARSTTRRSRCQHCTPRMRQILMARSCFDAVTFADGARNELACGDWNKKPFLHCHSRFVRKCASKAAHLYPCAHNRAHTPRARQRRVQQYDSHARRCTDTTDCHPHCEQRRCSDRHLTSPCDCTPHLQHMMVQSQLRPIIIISTANLARYPRQANTYAADSCMFLDSYRRDT